MLRITYEGKKTSFVFKGIKKAQCPGVIVGHLRMYGREQQLIDGVTKTVVLPKEGWQAVWQDGDTWNEDLPGEVVPIP